MAIKMFVKGQSGNKRGRPKGTTGFKGLAQDIRRRTKDGKELIDFAMKMFRDEKNLHHVRWDAFVWLTERGFGKAVQTIDVVSDQPKLQVNLAVLNFEQRSHLREIVKRIKGEPREVVGTALKVLDGGVTEDEPYVSEDVNSGE